MAKEKDTTLSKEERRAARKLEKEKKRSTTDGVHKSKDKKEKKKDRTVLAEKVENAIENGAVPVKDTSKANGELQDDQSGSDDDEGVDEKAVPLRLKRPVGALVPFANPLVDEKIAKKIFRGVKKAAAHRAIKRGVKESVKALRKSPTTVSSSPFALVILAADISPMDVISHIPVLCEDHSIPYVYVTSRAELGMAGQTKRPTSVVMLCRDKAKGKEKDKKDGAGEKEADDWKETYDGLVKLMEREGRQVKI